MTEPNYKNRPSAVRTPSQEVNSLSLRTCGYCRFDIVTSHTLHGCFPSYILGFSSIFIFYFNKSQAFFFCCTQATCSPWACLGFLLQPKVMLVRSTGNSKFSFHRNTSTSAQLSILAYKLKPWCCSLYCCFSYILCHVFVMSCCSAISYYSCRGWVLMVSGFI